MDIYKERIKPLFDKSGLMNKDLEAAIGIPQKKISDWNAERLKSYDKYIPQIAAYFGVSTDYLLGKTDDPTPAGQKETPPAQGGELPHAAYREVLSEGGMRILLDTDSKISEEDIDEIVQIVRMKQRKYEE